MQPAPSFLSIQFQKAEILSWQSFSFYGYFTAVLFLDMKSAFNNVNPGITCYILRDLSLPWNLYKCIYNLISIRSVFWSCPRFDSQSKKLLKDLARLKVFPPFTINSFFSSPNLIFIYSLTEFLSNCNLNILRFPVFLANFFSFFLFFLFSFTSFAPWKWTDPVYFRLDHVQSFFVFSRLFHSFYDLPLMAVRVLCQPKHRRRISSSSTFKQVGCSYRLSYTILLICNLQIPRSGSYCTLCMLYDMQSVWLHVFDLRVMFWLKTEKHIL